MDARSEQGSRKRGAGGDQSQGPSKKAKGKKQWRTPQQGSGGNGQIARNIEPGDAGIWATCGLGKEGKCVAELRDLLDEYAEKLYGSGRGDKELDHEAESNDAEGVDIEAEISNEIRELQKSGMGSSLFTHVRLDTDCVIFFKTRPPVMPVQIVHEICGDTAANPNQRKSRFVKRLTPITLMGKATEKGLEEVANAVLAPHFHKPEQKGIKFAIRPNLRNHTILSRDTVIKQVASAVGPGHQVDLKNYDLLILVELYKNVCGMSVVENDFEHLKRYNVSEIYDKFSSPTSSVQRAA